MIVCERLETQIPDQPTCKRQDSQVRQLSKNPARTDVCHSVDEENRKVEMSFRTKPSTASSASLLTLRDFQEGQVVNGHVKAIEDYGLFIELDDSKVSGLCHKSEVSRCRENELGPNETDVTQVVGQQGSRRRPRTT